MADIVKRDPSGIRAKLEGTLQAGSLAQLVKERKAERETFLLLDTSGSMMGYTGEHSQTRKIDALRRLVGELREVLSCPMVSFNNRVIPIVDGQIPNPRGETNLTAAIQYGAQHDASHLIVISDGCPGDPPGALKAAQAFGKPIDVFYVGPSGDYGEEFLAKLAKASGGKAQSISLAETKQIGTAIRGLIGTGGQ